MGRARTRLIARLDIKGPNVVKGIAFEGLRVMGDPHEHATSYCHQGADELLYLDIVASLYQRNMLLDLIARTTRNVFIPITVGGGVKGIDDAENLLRAGADRIAVNTAALKEPSLIARLAERFGSQCVVVSVEAKRRGEGVWEAFGNNGREPSGRDVVAWCREAAALGAGEILVTSVDQEGSMRGFDLALCRAVADAVDIPTIAAGGMGQIEDVTRVVDECGVDAVAIASVLHYRRTDLAALRAQALAAGLNVRRVSPRTGIDRGTAAPAERGSPARPS
jgi:cyclase